MAQWPLPTRLNRQHREPARSLFSPAELALNIETWARPLTLLSTFRVRTATRVLIFVFHAIKSMKFWAVKDTFGKLAPGP